MYTQFFLTKQNKKTHFCKIFNPFFLISPPPPFWNKWWIWKFQINPLPHPPQKLPRVMSTPSPCAICCRQYNGICSVVTGWGRLEDRTGTIAPPGCWTHFRQETPRSDPVERNKSNSVNLELYMYWWTKRSKFVTSEQTAKSKGYGHIALIKSGFFSKVNMVEQEIPIVFIHH